MKKSKKLFHLFMRKDNQKNIGSWSSTFRFFLSNFRRMTLMICVCNSIDLTMISQRFLSFVMISKQIDFLYLKSVHSCSISIIHTTLVLRNEFFFLQYLTWRKIDIFSSSFQKKNKCIIDDIHRNKSTQWISKSKVFYLRRGKKQRRKIIQHVHSSLSD